MAKVGKLSFPLTADTTAFARGAERVAPALADKHRLPRLMAFEVVPEFFAWFAREGERHFVVEHGIPLTAKFHHAFYEERRRSFVVVMEDDSFPESPEGNTMKFGNPPMLRIIKGVVDQI